MISFPGDLWLQFWEHNSADFSNNSLQISMTMYTPSTQVKVTYAEEVFS